MKKGEITKERFIKVQYLHSPCERIKTRAYCDVPGRCVNVYTGYKLQTESDCLTNHHLAYDIVFQPVYNAEWAEKEI